MNPDLVYQLSLRRVDHIGNVHAKTLCDAFPSARHIFQAPISELSRIEGIGKIRAQSIKKFRDFKKAEEEIAFIEKYRIKPLFLKDPDYPRRLLNCYDPPALLFYKGSADLNAPRIIAIVGSRDHTDYGRQAVEKLIRELGGSSILIASGLAYGIDALAHKAALKNQLPTVGVVGHGLDKIYPPENTELAKEMLLQGGLLTEFPSNTAPDKYHFPSRNRIVAGISDAIIVIESGIKGGSMITADLAAGYHREVFAIPGRISDVHSHGCNRLIQQNKAILLTGKDQLMEAMGWEPIPPAPTTAQQAPVELSGAEQQVYQLIARRETVSLDELSQTAGISAGAIASAILQLEMDHLIERLPGKMFRVSR